MTGLMPTSERANRVDAVPEHPRPNTPTPSETCVARSQRVLPSLPARSRLVNSWLRSVSAPRGFARRRAKRSSKWWGYSSRAEKNAEERPSADKRGGADHSCPMAGTRSTKHLGDKRHIMGQIGPLCHSTASESHLEHEPVELVEVVELYSESSRPLLAPKLQ